MVKIKDTAQKNKELKRKEKKKKEISSVELVSQAPKKTKIVKKKEKIQILEKVKPLKSKRYYEAIGRRKRAVARVRLFVRGEKTFLINDKPYNIYFSDLRLQQIAIDSLNKMNSLDRFRISVKVKGGGIHSQAEAIRHGISRALILLNPNFRKRLRKVGYLTRDPRERERKKFGLKRARRAPQWRKR